MDRLLFTSLLREPNRISLLDRGTVSSTNTLLKALGAEGAPEGTLMIAEGQTQGRGRLGRTFESPVGTGLYASLLLRPDMTVDQLNMITIFAAVAIAEGIEEVCGLRPEIKWVNDLYLDDRKVCGILAESSPDPDTGRPAYVVLGFGINLEAPQGGFTGSATGIAGALYRHGEAPKELREKLAAAIVNRLLAYYDETSSTEGDDLSYMERYTSANYVLGKDIFLLGDITRPETARPAHAVAIDPRGRLIVELPDGTKETISCGDVTVRIRH